MTIVEALKNLYAALGGDLDDVETVTTNAEMINAIANHVAEGGAAELPTVTAEDNGKVLKVVEGAWAKGTDLVE